MNNVVLKGKLGAGFNDDRYTLPKNGNEGDWLEKTATGAKWFDPLEAMIEADVLPAVKIGTDILGIGNDILMM